MAIQDLQREKMQTALSMSIPDLTAIANGAQSKYGVDSLTAVMALQIKGPAEKAARAQQAAQQPKTPTVKDQVVAQASDMGGGIANLPAENVMTEQAMAAGGIVAFQEGGRVPTEAEVQAAYRAWMDSKGPWYMPTPRGAEDRIRRKEQEYNRLLQAFQAGRPVEGLTAPVTAPTTAPAQTPTAAPVPSAAPTPTDVFAQQAPGGLPSAKLPAYPSFAPQFAKLASDYETAVGQVETPAAAAKRVMASPDYAGLLGPSPADVSAAFSPLESTIRGAFPQSEAEALAKIQQREAGLGALREEQRTQLEASKQEAEKSASIGKGEALLALAGTLVSTPISSPRFQEGIGNFTGMLRTVRKDLDSARKEYRTGIAKIAEAAELQKIGQAEKAEARFMEGQRLLADVQGKITTAQLASQSSQAQAAVSLGGAEAQRALDSLNKKTQITLSGIASEQQRAGDIFKGGVDLQQYQLLAGARSGAGGGRLENMAIDNARPRIKKYMEDWDADAKRGALKVTNNAEYMRQRQLEEARITQQIEAEEIQKLLRGGIMAPAAAPSGGGAVGLDLSQWGDPKLKTR